MRTLIVASLLASIALPATASADVGPFGRNRQAQSSSSTSSDDRSSQRSWGAAREARQERQRDSAPEPRRLVERPSGERSSVERQSVARQGDGQRSGWARRDRDAAAPTAPVVVEQQRVDQAPRGAWSRRDRRQEATTQSGAGFDRRLQEYRQSQRRPAGTVVRPTNNSPVMNRIARNAVRESLRREGFRTDWRNDRRYDWRHYRDYNRSIFYLGNYYDPFGYGYNRFQIGWSLWPSYYGQDYLINDPWMYRLPPAYGPYRWVRYWDDALLVNTYTGQVVDVVYDFFW